MGVTLKSPPATESTTGWAQRWMYPLALTSLGVNILIVLTGGVVRLTASGLGCPTWPRCTDESFVPHGELGLHGAIEFGNRLVTFLLAAVAIATFVTAWKYGRRSIVRLAFVLGQRAGFGRERANRADRTGFGHAPRMHDFNLVAFIHLFHQRLRHGRTAGHHAPQAIDALTRLSNSQKIIPAVANEPVAQSNGLSIVHARMA